MAIESIISSPDMNREILNFKRDKEKPIQGQAKGGLNNEGPPIEGGECWPNLTEIVSYAASSDGNESCHASETGFNAATINTVR